MLNLKRLALALVVVVPAVAAMLYFFVPRETDPTVRAASVVDAPGLQGRKLGLQSGEMAPNFEVSTHDGRRVKLSDFRGKPVLINFWARWCTSCLSEMPEIKALQAERGADGFVVLAVNAGETRAQAVEFIDFLKAPFTFALNPGLKLSDAYGVRGLPNSIFIDSTGVVQAVYAGHADRARLTAYMDAAAKAQPPAPQPLQLRPVSDIPRDGKLYVGRGGEELTFRGRSARCDFSYCADKVLDTLKTVRGFSEARFTTDDDGERTLGLRWNPAIMPVEGAITAVVDALVTLNDPVYEGRPAVEYTQKRVCVPPAC
jgi:peroxiredoxin